MAGALANPLNVERGELSRELNLLIINQSKMNNLINIIRLVVQNIDSQNEERDERSKNMVMCVTWPCFDQDIGFDSAPTDSSSRDERIWKIIGEHLGKHGRLLAETIFGRRKTATSV